MDTQTSEEISHHKKNNNSINLEVLKHYQRIRKLVISNDYVVYLEEYGSSLDDSLMFLQDISGNESKKWIEVMKEEMTSMKNNEI